MESGGALTGDTLFEPPFDIYPHVLCGSILIISADFLDFSIFKFLVPYGLKSLP